MSVLDEFYGDVPKGGNSRTRRPRSYRDMLRFLLTDERHVKAYMNDTLFHQAVDAIAGAGAETPKEQAGVILDVLLELTRCCGASNQKLIQYALRYGIITEELQ